VVTVLVALTVNVVIAVAKSVAATLTGSASMLAEAAHSWADSGNEIFLFVAGRRAARPPDEHHPLGHGREAYVWSLFAAFGLFAVGAVVSVMHGVQELRDPEPAEYFLVSYLVLAVSFVLEGTSFLRAYRQVRHEVATRDEDVLAYVLRTSDPTVRAVFFEDAAALVALLIAAVGIGAHQVTGSAVPDAVGSILVGLVLGVVAVVLIQQNRRFLVGEAVDTTTRTAALTLLLSQVAILRVTYLHLEYVGPNRVFLVAAVDLEGDFAEHTIAGQLNDLQDEVQRNEHVVRAVLTLAKPGAPALAVS
jgi:cation diffusion facilitator family transporter